MRDVVRLASLLCAGSLVALAYGGCGGTNGGFGPNGPPPDNDGGSSTDGSVDFPDGNIGNLLGDGSTNPDTSGKCVGLACQIDPCGTTNVSGVVYDPAGNNPLYNAIVYIPNAPLDPFKSGVTCDKCGVLASGNPLTTALTDAAGKFTLKNAPSGSNIPIVVQIGKWRRLQHIQTVKSCVDNPLTDKNLTRLPKNASEGDLPHIAIATGGADAFECLLRKIGVTDSEFTGSTSTAAGSGHIHLFLGTGGVGASGSPNVTSLWSSLPTMKTFDVMINACEGDVYPAEKPAGSIQNVEDYMAAGGRMFATHYHYYWLQQGATFKTTATFGGCDVCGVDAPTATIDTAFPKGQAFADWLFNVKASPTKGQLALSQVRYNVLKAVTPSLWWMQDPAATLLHYTFNAPVGAPDDQQCGKVVYSDFHVTPPNFSLGGTFPAECDSNPMTPQEAALEFMLFDLSACVQKDVNPPVPPPPPPR